MGEEAAGAWERHHALRSRHQKSHDAGMPLSSLVGLLNAWEGATSIARSAQRASTYGVHATVSSFMKCYT